VGVKSIFHRNFLTPLLGAIPLSKFHLCPESPPVPSRPCSARPDPPNAPVARIATPAAAWRSRLRQAATAPPPPWGRRFPPARDAQLPQPRLGRTRRVLPRGRARLRTNVRSALPRSTGQLQSPRATRSAEGSEAPAFGHGRVIRSIVATGQNGFGVWRYCVPNWDLVDYEGAHVIPRLIEGEDMSYYTSYYRRRYRFN